MCLGTNLKPFMPIDLLKEIMFADFEKSCKGKKDPIIYELSKHTDFGTRMNMNYYLIMKDDLLVVDKAYLHKLQWFKNYVWNIHSLFLSIKYSAKPGMHCFDICMMRLTNDEYYAIRKTPAEEMLDFFKRGGIYDSKYR